MKKNFLNLTVLLLNFLYLSPIAHATWTCIDFTTQSPRRNALFCKNDDPTDAFNFIIIRYDRLNGLNLTVGGESSDLDFAYSKINTFIKAENTHLCKPITILYEDSWWNSCWNCASCCLLSLSQLSGSEDLQEVAREIKLYGNKNILIRFPNKLASNHGIKILMSLGSHDDNHINELPKMISIWRRFQSHQY